MTARKMIPMIKEVLKKDNATKVIADGAYDSRRNFRFLSNSSIELPIKMKNTSTIARGCIK